jgi:hypothetical protein
VGETALQWAAQNSHRYLRFAGHRFCSPICQIDEYGGVANVFVAFRS